MWHGKCRKCSAISVSDELISTPCRNSSTARCYQLGVLGGLPVIQWAFLLHWFLFTPHAFHATTACHSALSSFSHSLGFFPCFSMSHSRWLPTPDPGFGSVQRTVSLSCSHRVLAGPFKVVIQLGLIFANLGKNNNQCNDHIWYSHESLFSPCSSLSIISEEAPYRQRSHFSFSDYNFEILHCIVDSHFPNPPAQN